MHLFGFYGVFFELLPQLQTALFISGKPCASSELKGPAAVGRLPSTNATLWEWNKRNKVKYLFSQECIFQSSGREVDGKEITLSSFTQGCCLWALWNQCLRWDVICELSENTATSSWFIVTHECWNTKYKINKRLNYRLSSYIFKCYNLQYICSSPLLTLIKNENDIK